MGCPTRRESRKAKMWMPVRRLMGAMYPVSVAKREPQIMSISGL